MLTRALAFILLAGASWPAPHADAQENPRPAPAAVLHVCGHVLSVGCSPGDETIIQLGADGTPTKFPVVIRQPDRAKFRPPPEQTYAPGAQICASGHIELFRELPRLLVWSPEQITIRAPATVSPPSWKGEYFAVCDEGVVSPKLTREVRPNYTQAAMDARKQGVVEAQALVLPNGTVGQVHVTKSLDRTTGLDEQAVAAVKQWRFQPGTRWGQAVAVVVTIELTFTLK